MYEQTGTLIKNKFREHLIPTVLTTMALSLATVVDSIIVGQLLGADALACIGIASPIINLMNIIYVIFGVGGMMCASVARGRWETEKANKHFTMGILGGAALMTLLLAVVLIFMGPISLMLAGGDKTAADLTAQYLTPILFTGPVLMLSNGIALFMRADGKPNKSAVVVITANIVNLIFDYILIKFCNTGIMGAGLSTTLGYVFGVFVVLPYICNHKGIRTFKFTKITKPLAETAEVVKTGLPKGCTYIATFLRSLVLNSIVLATLGTQGMTILTVLLNVLMFASIFVSGTGDTLLPIVGTLYGEKDIYGIRKTVESARNVLIGASIVIVIFFMTGSGIIGRLFGLATPEEFAMLKTALIMFSLYIPFYAICTTLQNFYNITERGNFAITIAICDGFIFVCSFAYILSEITPNILWLCYGLSSLFTFILILIIGFVIKSREAVKGLLLLKDIDKNEKVWNMTIDTDINHAEGLAKEIVSFCKAHNLEDTLSNKLGLGIEEMAAATITHAHKNKNGKIDIMIKVVGDEVLMRFRDNGDTFDVTAYKTESTDGLITDGIELLKAMANKVSYSSQLGFNITVLTFKI